MTAELVQQEETYDYSNALSNSKTFEQALKVAKFLSESQFVPQRFQKRPSDTLIALHLAARLGLSPFEIMNSLTVIQGKPCLSAALIIAIANTRGPFRKRINWEIKGTGKNMTVTAFTENSQGERVEASCSYQMAEAEGWTRNPKYRSMPEHMLKYRAATFLVRQQAPDCLMGLYSSDEMLDVQASKSPQERSKISDLNAKLEEEQ